MKREHFEKGDLVMFKSSGHGINRKMVGRIVAVVLPGIHASVFMRQHHFSPNIDIRKARDHVSYLIEVDGKLYWPTASRVRLG